MSVTPTSMIEPRKLLVSGGTPAGPPVPAQDGPRERRADPAPAPAPVDESAAGREDWRAEVLGTTWMRVP